MTEQAPIAEFFECRYRPERLIAASGDTISSYRTTLRSLQHWWRRSARSDQPRLADFGDPLIVGVRNCELEKGNAPPTANKAVRNLAALANHAADCGLIHYRPRLKRLKVREYEREPDAWTVEEFGRILEAAEDLEGYVGPVKKRVWWPAMLLVVYSTGRRIDTVMQLPTARVNLETGWILAGWETQKERADQWMRLLPDTVTALRRLDPAGRDLRRVFDDWPYDRTQRGWPALTGGLRKILRMAGLPEGRRDLFHKIRRTYATLIAGQAGEVVAQQMLGHSSLSVTRRYLDRRQLKQPSAAELLPSPRPAPEDGGLRLFDPDQETG